MAPLPWTAFKVGFASLAAGALISLGALMLLFPQFTGPLYEAVSVTSLAVGIGFAAWTVRLVSKRTKF